MMCSASLMSTSRGQPPSLCCTPMLANISAAVLTCGWEGGGCAGWWKYEAILVHWVEETKGGGGAGGSEACHSSSIYRPRSPPGPPTRKHTPPTSCSETTGAACTAVDTNGNRCHSRACSSLGRESTSTLWARELVVVVGVDVEGCGVTAREQVQAMCSTAA